MASPSRQLNEIAEQIVYGKTLADKLTPMGKWSDTQRPSALASPTSPGRICLTPRRS